MRTKLFTEKVVRNFVYREIDAGPQIVSIPITPERHAFFVNVTEEKVLISDWGGSNNKNKGDEFPQWKNYSDIMKFLEEKYEVPIEYYPIVKDIYQKSLDRHVMCGNKSGCSTYVYDWVDRYY